MTPCQRNPPELWDVGDAGNRLALYLCRTCPSRPTCGDGKQYGVIRAGVAWSDHGRPLPLCACDYPLDKPGGRYAHLCKRCSPPVLRRWGGRREYWRRYYLSRRAA